MRFLTILGRAGTAGLLIFFGLMAAVCIALPFTLGSASLGSSVNDRMTEASSLTAEAAGSQIKQLKAGLETAIDDDRLLSGRINPADRSDPVRQMLDTLTASNPNVRTVAYLDANGMILVDSPLSSVTGKDFSYRPYFTQAIRDPYNVYVSDPFEAKIPDSPTVISISTAVFAPATLDQPRRIVGVLVFAVDVNASLRDYVSSFERSQGVDVSIFDSTGKEIVGSSGAPVDETFLDEVRTMAGATSVDETGLMQKTSDGRFVYSLRIVPGTSYLVAASATEDAAYGALHDFQDRMMVLGALAGTGMFIGLALLARSIRLRDQALREARATSKRTAVILETAAEAFVECDIELRVTSWNRAAELMFAWPREEALGRNMNDLIAPDWRRETANNELRSAFEQEDRIGTTMRGERPVVRRDSKHPFPVTVSAWLTDFEGERRLAFFFEDVTERRQLDAARELVFRRQRELVDELRQADKTKSDFMSTVSHELRTPLTSILGYLEMLREGHGGTFNKQATSMIEVIDRNSQRLLNMIEDLLTLARIESGAEKTLNSLVDVRFLALAAQQSLVPQARERSLAFDVDVANSLPLLTGDADQLERVFINLLSNAIKFTPVGGTVGLEASLFEDSVRIVVSDTGIGIAEDEQKKLFSRFFRTDEAQAKAIQGTGLGLAIVKSIVDRHGGNIAIESEIGVGTKVTVTLPVRSHISEQPGLIRA